MRKLYNAQTYLFSQYSDHKISKQLQAIDKILEKLPQALEWVAKDLAGGGKENTGATGMSAEQVLRAGIVKQQNQWSYETLELQCVDSMSTQAFIRLEGTGFSKSCLHSNISRISAVTWKRINDAIVGYAAEHKLENGRTVRMDATVVESHIHKPSDSQLLYDCIRVVSHRLKKIRRSTSCKVYAPASAKDAKHLVLGIINAKDQRARKVLYRKLLKLSKKLDREFSGVLNTLSTLELSGRLASSFNQLKNISLLLPLIIDQTQRRVIKGEQVSSEEKIVSIFEEHTDIIVKGRREVEYGHKVYFTAGKSGLVSDCQLVQGNPGDSTFFIDLIEKHKQLYGRVPRQTSADGSFASEDNVFDAKDLGVKDVCFSKRCGLAIEEMVKSQWVFNKLKNFRAGIEGVISVLKRGFGLDRSMWKGVSGFGAYVHSSVVAYNLTLISRMIT